MKRSLIVAATIVALTLPTICQAAAPRPGAYVSGFIGVNIPKDTDVTTDFYNPAGTINDRVEFDPGIFIGGTGGYDFGMIRLEGELSYKHSEINSVTDQTNGINYRRTDGNLGALAMMANAFFDLDTGTPVTPYWGGGIGFATLHLSDTSGIDTQSPSGQPTLLYREDDATVFAYQAGAGMEIALNRKLSLDVGYRYFGTTKATFDKDWTRTTKLKFESHNVAVGIRVKF